MMGLILLIILIVFGKKIFEAIQDAISAYQNRKEEERRAIAERDRQQRQKWASELKMLALENYELCNRNFANAKPMVVGEYKAGEQIEEIIKALSTTSLLKGSLDAMADAVLKEEMTE